jgi:hypothetical protein
MLARSISILMLICFLSLPLQTVSAAPSLADVIDDKAIIDFPQTITFQARITANSPITSVTLEYGSEQLTCGTVIAKAFPQFQPGKDVSVSWAWDMRQSGSLPPGETIWWRWRVMDSDGQETISEQKTVIWLDSVHNWQTITDGNLNLHWYSNDKSYASDLLSAASRGLERLQTDAGLTLDAPMDFYIYANTDDMKEAILYEPSWTGGLAFPENDIVILGISTKQIEWGRDSIVHELTHVVVGHLTFSCLGDVPTWLNEGLAVYSEGELDAFSQEQLDTAIREDTLVSIRSLSGGFSEVADRATLSYSQSYSVVKFLIETYGQDKMNSLLLSLRDGTTVDAALLKTYNFNNVEELEQEWRKAIGARPAPVTAQATALPSPTFVPTIVPVSGVQLAVTPTPFAIPTSAVAEPTQPASIGGTRVILTVVMLGLCCLLMLIIGVIALGVIVRNQNQKKGGSK